MRKLMLVAALAVTLPGCAAWQKVQPVLNDVQATITDASAIIDAVQSVVDVFFALKPNAELEVKVKKAIGDVSLGLSVAARALRGVENASQEQLDAAWRDFRGSYAELLVILRDVGIVSSDGKMATRRGSVVLPEPLAVGHR